MSVEALLSGGGQLALPIHGLAEQRLELGAFDPVFCFIWHQITCLYVRCRRRASSDRPRLILDLTVPSGTLRAVAISRKSISCKSLKIPASRSSGDSFCSAKCTISRVSRLCTWASGGRDWSAICSLSGCASSCSEGAESSESVIRSPLLLRKWSTSRLRVMVVTQVMNAPLPES